MTDQELKDLVAGLAAAQVETGREQRETSRELKELARGTDRQFRETDERIRALSEAADRRQQELRESQRQTDRQIKELRESQRQTDRQLKELGQELGQQIKELGQQIGGLGEKFGTYTEGLAETGVRKLLKERFGASAVAIGFEVKKNGETMELDGYGYSNTGHDAVYVVEIKSKLRRRGIDQLLKTLRRFPEFFPEHRGKKLYGVLAVADVSKEVAAKALERGLYLARLGTTVELAVPDDFKPHSFQ